MMRLAFATFALVAIANGIAFKEDSAPIDLPEIENETEPVELVKLEDKQNSTKFNAFLNLAKNGGPMPNAKTLAGMTRRQRAMLRLANKEGKEFVRRVKS